VAHIKIENVCKSYGEQNVLKNISLEIQSGSQITLLGASGSGKSTLLYLLGGLDRVDSGTILVDQLQIDHAADSELALYRNRDVGFIFQFHFLLPSMSCLDNIMLPCEIGGFDRTSVKKRVVELADKLAVTQCLKKFPYQLSGGEQQRVNIIRALSLSPKLLLCDEPTGNLDSVNSLKVTTMLKELSREHKVTLLLVTHDQNVASHFEHKISIEDGRIIS
jgi:ABC-type lipoprotein export system ATPase subunit